MVSAISPTQSNILQALGTFIGAVLPGDVQIVAGQQNRTSEPQVQRFVVMTPISMTRLATNIDTMADCKFVGSIASNVLTVTEEETGTIASGSVLFGPGVTPGTVIGQQLTADSWQVSITQTVGSTTLSAGSKQLMQTAEIVVQCDFHSVDPSAGDLAQTVSTAIRDDFGVSFFAALPAPLNGVTPFYGDDPRQIVFMDGESQVEFRWTLDIHLEVNQVISVQQTYADSATVTLKDVTALFPPS